jgi:hypothetical protein
MIALKSDMTPPADMSELFSECEPDLLPLPVEVPGAVDPLPIVDPAEKSV